MSDSPWTASDASYHSRHHARSLRRAERMAEYISGPANVLDVGCNKGVTSRHLLNLGVARRVTGIELLANTVTEELRSDSRFSLIEGDIASVALPEKYDVAIYGAVHHHVLHHHGLGVAVAVLQKLVCCSRRSLFFETGHLSEGGRWGWQRAIRRYFRTDEEHIFYLLSCVEHLIDDFRIIGRFRIHGVRRWLIELSIRQHADADDRDVVVPGARGPGTGEVYGRTFGSSGQQLLSRDNAGFADSPVLLATSDDGAGEKVFLKRHVHRPAANAAEYRISRQIPHAWAVRCMRRVHDGTTLAFPYIKDAIKVEEVADAPAQDRRSAADAALRIFRQAASCSVDVDNRVLLRSSRPVPLTRICDFNPNNFLVVGTGETLTIKVVDFEQHSLHNDFRNRIHLCRILVALRQRRLRGALQYAIGVVGAVGLMTVYQARPPAVRIRHRQPGLFSVVVTEFRSVGGRLFGRLLGLLGIE